MFSCMLILSSLILTGTEPRTMACRLTYNCRLWIEITSRYFSKNQNVAGICRHNYTQSMFENPFFRRENCKRCRLWRGNDVSRLRHCSNSPSAFVPSAAWQIVCRICRKSSPAIFVPLWSFKQKEELPRTVLLMTLHCPLRRQISNGGGAPIAGSPKMRLENRSRSLFNRISGRVHDRMSSSLHMLSQNSVSHRITACKRYTG